MLETLEDKLSLLAVAGEELEFEGDTIMGIPGHLVYNVQGYDSIYDIEKQDFSFQILQEDFVELDLKKGDSFIYSTTVKAFTFEIVTYTDDIIGWVELNVKLVEVADV